MPQAYGLTDKGFKAKDLSTIESDLQTGLRKHVDATLRFGADSVAGVITAIVAMEARQVWESLSGLYNSLQPDTSTGRALDALCSLTGTYRKLASKSRTKAIFTLKPNSEVPKGSLVLTTGGYLFKVSAAVVNKESTEKEIQADLEADEFGAIIAHPKTIGEIKTPVTGWSKVVFTQTDHVGNFLETDDELRLRRMNQLRAAGTSTVDAVRERIRRIAGVQAVILKETNHSFEAIVMGGEDKEIAQTIWHCRPIGVGTTGKIKCIITNSIKEEKEIFFSRPTEIPLTLEAHLKVKRALNDDDTNRIKNAIADFAKLHFSLGSEVYSSRFFAVLLSDSLILDVTNLQFRIKATGNVPSEIKPEEIASLTPSDITIKPNVETAQ